MSIVRKAFWGSLTATILAVATPLAPTPAGAQLSGGKASLIVGDVARGEKTPLTVSLAVGGSNVNLRRVFVRVRCTEQIEVPHSIAEEKDDKGKLVYPSKSFKVTRSEVIFEKEFTISGGQELDARSHHTFKGEIEIPADLPPSFKGKYARFKWEAQGKADTSAWIDRGSSWQDITVK